MAKSCRVDFLAIVSLFKFRDRPVRIVYLTVLNLNRRGNFILKADVYRNPLQYIGGTATSRAALAESKLNYLGFRPLQVPEISRVDTPLDIVGP